MKKLRYLIILILLIVVFPSNSFAYELICNRTDIKKQNAFSCRINEKTFNTYEEISGTIPNNEYIKCSIYSFDNNLTNNSNGDKFLFSGTNKSNDLVTFKCTLESVLEKDVNSQLFINDFKYKTKNESESIILRSQYLTLKKYEEDKVVDTKPRDTSHRESRLQSLSVGNIDINFSSFVTKYNLYVLNDVTRVNIKATPALDTSNVRIVGKQDLVVGENIIDIYVTSEDSKYVTCYTLNVKRLDVGEEMYYPEKDATIEALTIKNYNINFDKNILDYSLVVANNVDKLDIEATPTNKEATINITGNKELNNGSIVTISVTSEDKSEVKRYNIKIIKKVVVKKDYSQLIFFALVFAIIVIILIIILSDRKRRKKEILELQKIKEAN